MKVEDGLGGVLEGNNISVNYTTKDFTAENISTEYPPLRILSAKEISSQKGKQTLRGATVTCCDKADPHYTLSVGKLTVSPQKRVFGTNAVLRLDGFPVFYLPVFWRSLDSQKPWTTYVEFTQSNKTGFGIMTSTVFQPFLQLRPKLNLDYYTKSSFGFGGELTAVQSATLRGVPKRIILTTKPIMPIWTLPAQSAGGCRAVTGGRCTIPPTISTPPPARCTSSRRSSARCPTRIFMTLSSAATHISLCRTRKQTSPWHAKPAVLPCA